MQRLFFSVRLLPYPRSLPPLPPTALLPMSITALVASPASLAAWKTLAPRPQRVDLLGGLGEESGNTGPTTFGGWSRSWPGEAAPTIFRDVRHR